MKLIANNLYHVYNRGNNKERIFYSRENYLFFLDKIRNSIFKECNILCYCLMPNHFHFLIHIPDRFEQEKFSEELKICLRSYTRSINRQEDRVGSLFQQHTKFKCLTMDDKKSEGYALSCFYYIHQNPLTSGLVDKIENREFSSFKDYASMRNGSLCNKEITYELFEIPKDCNEFYNMSYDLVNENKIKGLL
jgi:putative transposase